MRLNTKCLITICLFLFIIPNIAAQGGWKTKTDQFGRKIDSYEYKANSKPNEKYYDRGTGSGEKSKSTNNSYKSTIKEIDLEEQKRLKKEKEEREKKVKMDAYWKKSDEDSKKLHEQVRPIRYVGENGKIGFKSSNNTFNIPAIYEKAGDTFGENNGEPHAFLLVPVMLNKKWGMIGNTGAVIKDFKYDFIERRVSCCDSNKYVSVKLKNKWGLISYYNDDILPIIYDEPIKVSGTMAKVKYNGKYETIDLLLRDFIDPSKMVSVQGGTFTMGCTNEQINNCNENEKPAHVVSVNNFKMYKYEVYQSFWKFIMGHNPSKFNECDNCPVEQVSWDDVQEFMKKLNERSEKQYRLPTEAEWEYAARGGSKSKGYKYSGGNEVENTSWLKGNSANKTHPVAQKEANELGIFDMTGNVGEWCSDWHANYNNGDQKNNKGILPGKYKAIRGGSWNYDSDGCRVSYRDGDSSNVRFHDIGFRIVLDEKVKPPVTRGKK